MKKFDETYPLLSKAAAKDIEFLEMVDKRAIVYSEDNGVAKAILDNGHGFVLENGRIQPFVVDNETEVFLDVSPCKIYSSQNSTAFSDYKEHIPGEERSFTDAANWPNIKYFLNSEENMVDFYARHADTFSANGVTISDVSKNLTFFETAEVLAGEGSAELYKGFFKNSNSSYVATVAEDGAVSLEIFPARNGTRMVEGERIGPSLTLEATSDGIEVIRMFNNRDFHFGEVKVEKEIDRVVCSSKEEVLDAVKGIAPFYFKTFERGEFLSFQELGWRDEEISARLDVLRDMYREIESSGMFRESFDRDLLYFDGNCCSMVNDLRHGIYITSTSTEEFKMPGVDSLDEEGDFLRNCYMESVSIFLDRQTLNFEVCSSVSTDLIRNYGGSLAGQGNNYFGAVRDVEVFTIDEVKEMKEFVENQVSKYVTHEEIQIFEPEASADFSFGD